MGDVGQRQLQMLAAGRSERSWSPWEGVQASFKCHVKPLLGFKQEGDVITVLRCSREKAIEGSVGAKLGRASRELRPGGGETPGWVSGWAVGVGLRHHQMKTAVGRGWRGWAGLAGRPVLPALTLGATGVQTIPGTLRTRCPQAQMSVDWNTSVLF